MIFNKFSISSLFLPSVSFYSCTNAFSRAFMLWLLNFYTSVFFLYIHYHSPPRFCWICSLWINCSLPVLCASHKWKPLGLSFCVCLVNLGSYFSLFIFHFLCINVETIEILTGTGYRTICDTRSFILASWPVFLALRFRCIFISELLPLFPY